MYFSVPGYTDTNNKVRGWGIGIAENTDLKTLIKVAEVNEDPTATYEAKGSAAPCALVIDGRVNLFYQTYINGTSMAFAMPDQPMESISPEIRPFLFLDPMVHGTVAAPLTQKSSGSKASTLSIMLPTIQTIKFKCRELRLLPEQLTLTGKTGPIFRKILLC